MQKILPTLVVTRGGTKIDPPPLEELKEVESFDSSFYSSLHLHSSEDSCQFSDLESTLKETTKEVRFNENLPIGTKLDENENQFIQISIHQVLE